MEENIGADDVALTPADVKAIETAVAETAIEGRRYGDNEMMMVNL